jgi:histidyl-tRNA synthetase
MRLCAELWAAGINAEFGFKPNQNFKTDIIGAAKEQGIPFVVLFGDEELAKGEVKVKDMAAETQHGVARTALPEFLKGLIAKWEDKGF